MTVWHRIAIWEIFGIVFSELNDIEYEIEKGIKNGLQVTLNLFRMHIYDYALIFHS